MKTIKNCLPGLAALLCLAATNAGATVFTSTSPTSKGALPLGVTSIGGIVLDGVGLNGARLVSQLSATSLYQGFANANPLTIGVQSGLTPALLANLGGGFSELAVRFTLFDGDSAAGNFDYNQNSLLLNGVNLGNWSSVIAEQTNANGTGSINFSSGGFRNNILDTGWFYSTNSSLLSSVYGSLGSGNLSFQLQDSSAGDNYYDFKQGVDGSLINVGSAPIITPPSNSVPDGGSTLGMLALAMFGIKRLRDRKSK